MGSGIGFYRFSWPNQAPLNKSLGGENIYFLKNMKIRQIQSDQVFIDTLDEPMVRYEVAAGVHFTFIVPVIDSVLEPRVREVVLQGEQAVAEVFGIFLGQYDDVLKLKLDTTHVAPNTRGRTEFRAVLAGKSTLEFDGMIKIMKDAQNSLDFLQQDSLLLSEDAKSTAVPGLEIEANEVKASHGATAKPVDPEQKFYLMSRGLSEEQAEAMIVYGFLAPILEKVAEAEWKKKIGDMIERKYNLPTLLANNLPS